MSEARWKRSVDSAENEIETKPFHYQFGIINALPK